MKKLVAALAAAALLLSGAAPPAFAERGFKHRGFGHGTSHYGGHYYKHRPYYRHGYGHGYGHHYGHHHGYYYFHGHGDAAVVLGVLAGAVVLGALLAQPRLPPARPAYARALPRSPSGAPLGNCLQTTGTGTWNGRPARFTGTMCYDPAGRAYVLPGSERFVGYLR